MTPELYRKSLYWPFFRPGVFYFAVRIYETHHADKKKPQRKQIFFHVHELFKNWIGIKSEDAVSKHIQRFVRMNSYGAEQIDRLLRRISTSKKDKK
jgi:hypothetical protein